MRTNFDFGHKSYKILTGMLVLQAVPILGTLLNISFLPQMIGLFFAWNLYKAYEGESVLQQGAKMSLVAYVLAIVSGILLFVLMKHDHLVLDSVFWLVGIANWFIVLYATSRCYQATKTLKLQRI